jgi:hypothetical protein
VDTTTRTLLPDELFVRKIFLQDDRDARRLVLKEFHDTPSAGHPGIANTWELVREHYEGPRLRDFVEEYYYGMGELVRWGRRQVCLVS